MRTVNIIVLAVLITFTTSSIGSRRPKKYQRNKHVTHDVRQTSSYYALIYQFKDQHHSLCRMEFTFNRDEADRLIQDYGIPTSMFKPYIENQQVLQERARILEDGLFVREDNKLVPDYRAMIDHYQDFLQPVANALVQVLQESGRDSRSERIEIAMKFVQDIPYAIPNNDTRRMYYGGITSPPETLLNGYGDCDTKVILFICILSHLIDRNDIVIIDQPGHLLTAIRGKKPTNGTYIKYKGATYILAETAGPGRMNWGEIYDGVPRVSVIDI